MHAESAARLSKRAFYTAQLQRAMAAGWLTHASRVLILCGGPLDRQACLDAGLTEVTVSNLDDARLGEAAAQPFAWAHQDAEHLTYADGSYDVVVVHDGLHHCASPHRALLEMYRVARQGLLVIESRDTWLRALAVRLGFTADSEVTAVAQQGWVRGGWRNTGIPNYVYCWTEREVRKTLAAADPYSPAQVQFVYGVCLPLERLQRHHPGAYRVARLLAPVVLGLCRLVPRQGNRFAFLVRKPQGPADLHPWCAWQDGAATVQPAWESSAAARQTH